MSNAKSGEITIASRFGTKVQWCARGAVWGRIAQGSGRNPGRTNEPTGRRRCVVFSGWRHSWVPQAMASAPTVRRAVLRPADSEKIAEKESPDSSREHCLPGHGVDASFGSETDGQRQVGYRALGIRRDAERREVLRRGFRLRRGHGPRHRPRPRQHRRHPRREDRQG